MPGEFVGRPRPLWKILLYGALTFGIYGRVYLYRTVREIDGHQVYFLDLRLYRLALILPFGGPLAVKSRLLRLAREVVQHDVTAPRLPTGWMRLLSFLPLIPVYHVLLQWHLEKHWSLHRRIDDLAGRRLMIDQLKHHAATDEDRARLAQMEDEVQERERALEEARKAAIALHDAKVARARARRQMKAAGVHEPLRDRISLGRLLGRFRRREAEVDAEPEEPAPLLTTGGPSVPEAGAAEPAPGRPFYRKRITVPDSRLGAPGPIEELPTPPPEPVQQPVAEPHADEPAQKRGWFGRRKKGTPPPEPETPSAPESEPVAPTETHAEAPAEEPPKKRFGFLRRARPADEAVPEAATSVEPIPPPVEESVPPAEEPMPAPKKSKRRK